MNYYFPFGEKLKDLKQQDKSPKKVFVLGVYSSAVHACWKKEGRTICPALAVASEPYIFWDGNEKEAQEIINNIKIPNSLGTLEPANKNLNGPSAKVLVDNILSPLGFTRNEAWLCDLLPQARLNSSQQRVIKEKYNPLIKEYNLNEVTIPKRPTKFCDEKRIEEITQEIMDSKADLLVLLGDIPIKDYLNEVSNINYTSLKEYSDLYGYGNQTEVIINNKKLKVLPLAHPRQIGALGLHSEKWYNTHLKWEKSLKK